MRPATRTTAGPYTLEVTCIDARLTAALVSAEPAASSPFSVTLTAAITNTGSATLPAGLPVAFSSGIEPIGSVVTTQPIAANQAVTVTLDWPVDTPGDYDIVVSPNAGGTAAAPASAWGCAPQTAGAVRTISVLDLSLDTSWNLVSSAVDPLVHAVSTVQRPIAGEYFVIQGFDGGRPHLLPEPAA